MLTYNIINQSKGTTELHKFTNEQHTVTIYFIYSIYCLYHHLLMEGMTNRN